MLNNQLRHRMGKTDYSVVESLEVVMEYHGLENSRQFHQTGERTVADEKVQNVITGVKGYHNINLSIEGERLMCSVAESFKDSKTIKQSFKWVIQSKRVEKGRNVETSKALRGIRRRCP